jgi:hypothetical protein
MAAKITRAKKKIAAARIPYRVPPADELPGRIEAVLTIVHLLFTTGPDGPVDLRDLFGDRRQLSVYNFMFDPACDEGCPSCSHLVSRQLHGRRRSHGRTQHVLRGRLARTAGPFPGCRLSVPASSTIFTSRWTKPPAVFEYNYEDAGTLWKLVRSRSRKASCRV